MTPLRFDFLFQDPLVDEDIAGILRRLPAAQALRCHAVLTQALELLPEVELSPAQRRHLQGYLLADARALVEGTAEALRDSPRLFPEVPDGAAAAAALSARQHSADALVALLALLETLNSRAWALFLLLQAGATKEALARASALCHPIPTLLPEENLLRKGLAEILRNKD